ALVVGKGEAAGLVDIRLGNFNAIEIQGTVGGQPVDAHDQVGRVVTRVTTAMGDDEVADHRIRVVRRLAFEDHAGAGYHRRLVHGRDVDGDVHLLRIILGRGAIVDGQAELVGGVLVGSRGRVDVLHLAIQHVLVREDGVHTQSHTLNLDVAVAGQPF